jgi:hypothetical protein
MMRMGLILVLAVASGVLVRTFAQLLGPSPVISTANSTADPDPALALRSLGGATCTNKPWANDFAAFVTSHPGRWIVGRTAHPCLSEPEASRKAHSDAANVVYPLIAERFNPDPVDADWLRKRVAADVLAGRLDADCLAERFTRPYGTVWTESVLLDVSPQRLDSLLHSYQADQSQWRAHSTRIRQSIAISVVGAWLAYLLLNTITKGYFTMRLRLAAALVTAAGVALLI